MTEAELEKQAAQLEASAERAKSGAAAFADEQRNTHKKLRFQIQKLKNLAELAEAGH